MDERVVQFRVGVMVLATIIITGILIVLFNRVPTFGKGTYTIYVRFPTAPGVAENTPVRRSGILIGRVSDVEFDENYNVIATLRIDGDHTIFESDHIRITRSLLGDSELEVVRQAPPQAPSEPHEAARPEIPSPDAGAAEPQDLGDQDGVPPESEASSPRRKRFMLAVLRPARHTPYLLAVLQPGGAQPPPIRDAQPAAPGPARGAPRGQQPPRGDVPVQPGTTVQGRVTTTPLESFEDLRDDFQQAASALSNAGNEVGTLSRNLNNIFQRNEKQIDRIISQTDEALSSFQRAMTNVNEILGDAELRDNVKQALRDLPKMLQETQRAIGGIEGAMRLVESNLRNLEGLTEPLGQRGEAIVGNIDSGIARLNEILGQAEQFSRSLNSRQGTLGQLINNPDIYEELNAAAANINELTTQLRPIVRDVRIFTDKIARHPGVIIRDAVKPGSGTKWVTE